MPRHLASPGFRRFLIGAALLLGLVLAARPLLGELARRQAEQALGRALRGKASVARARVQGPRRVRLSGIEVDEPAAVPLVDRLSADSVQLRASGLRQALRGGHERVRIEGLEIRAEPGGEAAADAAPAPSGALRRGRYEIASGRLVVPAASAVAVFRFSGQVQAEEQLTATLEFRSGRLPVAALLELAPDSLPAWLRERIAPPVLEPGEGRIRLTDAKVDVVFDSPGGRLPVAGGERRLEAVHGRALLGLDGEASLRLSTAAEGLRALRLRAERRTGEGWELASAQALGVDAALLVPWRFVPEDWSLQGECDLRWGAAAGGQEPMELAARLPRLELPFGGGRLALEGLELAAAGAPADGAFELARSSAAAATARWRADGGDEAVAHAAQASATGRLATDAAELSALHVKAPAARLDLPPGEGDPDERAIALRAVAPALSGPARWRRGERSQEWTWTAAGELAELHVEIEGLAALDASPVSGQARLVGGVVEGRGRFAATAVNLESSAARVRLVEHEAALALSRARLAGALSAREVVRAAGAAWELGDSEARLSARRLALERPWSLGTALEASTWSWLSAGDEGEREDARLRASGRLGELAGTIGGARWSLPRPRFELEARPLRGDWSLRVPATGARLELEQLSEPLELEASARARLAGDGAPPRGGLELDAGALGRLRLALDERAPAGGTAGRLDVDGLSLAAWRPLLDDAWPEGWPRRVEGEAALGGRVVAEDGRWRVEDGQGRLSGLGAESESGLRVFRGLGAELEWSASRSEDGKPLRVQALASRLGGFELAWGGFYGDWSERFAEARLVASIDPESPALEALRVELHLGGEDRLLLVQESGAGSTGLGWRFDDLASTWQRWLAEPAAGWSVAEELTLAGTLQGELELARDGEARSLAGSLALEGFDARHEPLGLALRELALELPLEARWTVDAEAGARRGVTGPLREGRLAFESLHLAGLELEPADTTLRVEGEQLRLDDPLHAPIADGRAVLRGLRLEELLQEEPRLVARLELDGLDLARVSDSLDLLPLEGRLDAEFPELVLTSRRLRLEGGASGRAFDGELQLGDVVVERPFDPVPVIRLDLRARGLDLARLTSRVGFGRITGRLDGHVTGLELQGSAPVRFQARFETVKRPGVKQRVSVEAAQDITELGSGGRAPIFESWWLRFVDDYAYDRAGFEAELDHGILRLRGVASRDGRELFVKGSAPLRLDVVNADPGRALSFRRLLERLENMRFEDLRIDRGAPTSDR